MIDIETIVNREEYELRDIYSNIEDICSYNSYKVLKAFKDNKVSETDFNSTTGYGYLHF